MARVGRFQVMATLQAARALALGLSEAEAESWGLNRAIFYAAAKRGFWRTPAARSTTTSTHPHAGELTGERVTVGGEQAFAVEDGKERLRFVIGGEAQTPEDFRRQVVTRFPDWEAAWAEAQALIAAADPESLRHGDRFFREVYQPQRDELAAKWSGVAAHLVAPRRRPARPREDR